MTDRDPIVKDVLERAVPDGADATPDWDDVLRRSAADGGEVVELARPPRRRVWYALAAAALVTALLVNPAFGLGPSLMDWFEGSPAPERVKENLASMNADRDHIVALFDGESQDVLADQARGVVALETRQGPAYLWVAPTTSGGWCTYVEVPATGPEASAGAGCETGRDILRDRLAVRMGSQEYGADELFLLEGRADPPIRSLEIEFADGSRDRIPIVKRWFLYEVPAGEALPFVVTGRDAAGAVVEKQVLPDVRDLPRKRTAPVAHVRKVIEIRTRTGVPASLWTGQGRGREACYAVDLGTSSSMETCGLVRGLVSAGVLDGAGPGRRIVLVYGVVAARVASLELLFEDGDRVPLRLVERFFLYEVPPAHFRTGHLPSVFVARDASGAVIGRQGVADTPTVGMP